MIGKSNWTHINYTKCLSAMPKETDDELEILIGILTSKKDFLSK